MEEVFENQAHLSKGINLREMMSSGTEFHIDLDFKKKSGMAINMDDDLFPAEEDDSDTEDVIELIEKSAEKKLLASPEYHSFDELAKKMIDCDAAGNVKLMILEEGDGPLISSDCEVTLHYAAYWEKATIPFDSTLTMNSGMPMRLRLGCGSIIPGLELGLLTLKGPKAHCLLLLQPKVAWGTMAVKPRILPQPSLFVIAVYDVRDLGASARFNDLPTAEQSKYEVTQRTVKSIHSQAKQFFLKRKYAKAIKNYQQSITVLNLSRPETEEELNHVKKLKISALLNLAVCYSKIDKPKYVIRMLEALDFITDVDNNCKALFYYGKAYEMLGNTELAIEYYKKALKLEPKNKDIGRTLDNLDNYLKTSSKKEKEMWQNVFKAEDTEEKINVDEDFQNGVREMFEDLARNKEYAKFDLPPRLNKNEVDFVKKLAEDFENLKVFEEGDGKKKRITIVKKIT